jgi:hypothetical protein
MVKSKLAVPVPELLVALSVIIEVAYVAGGNGTVGIPEICPVVVSSDKPAGRFVAP